MTNQKPTYYDTSFIRNSIRLTSPNQTLTGTTSGVSVPGWRRKIGTGQFAGSDYDSDRYRVLYRTRADLSYSFADTWVEHPALPRLRGPVQSRSYDGLAQPAISVENPVVWKIDHLPVDMVSEDNSALSKMYERIRNENYDVNGLLFLGEARKAIHLLRHPAESLRKGVSKYLKILTSTDRKVRQALPKRRGSVAKNLAHERRKALKDAMAGSWLELQFGLKPLISDSEGIVKAAKNAISLIPKRGRLQATSPGATGGLAFTHTTTQDEVQVIGSYQRKTVGSVRYVCGIDHSSETPATLLDTLGERLGFRAENFVPTIYELIPWSFLIDYFVNVGEILEAACTDTSKVLWVVKDTRRVSTVVNSTEARINLTGPYDVLLTYSGSHLGRDSVSRHTLSRRIVSALPMPGLQFSIPGAGSLKWANMAALLATSSRRFNQRL